MALSLLVKLELDILALENLVFRKITHYSRLDITFCPIAKRTSFLQITALGMFVIQSGYLCFKVS